MLLTDEQGLPISLSVKSASPHESTLLEELIDEAVLPLPKNVRLLYDKAADSEMLRWMLEVLYQMCLIAPYKRRRNETKARRLPHHQRKAYRNRYRVERTFAWLKNLRRLQVRHEYDPKNYKGFWMVGILFTMLRRL